MNTEIIVALMAFISMVIVSVFRYIKHLKAILLGKKLDAKKEAYSFYIESLCNYMFENKPDTIKRYQHSRMKMVLYADDETIRAFFQGVPSGIDYNIEDPISTILYALRKDVDPSTSLKKRELAGVDPTQFEFLIVRQIVDHAPPFTFDKDTPPPAR